MLKTKKLNTKKTKKTTKKSIKLSNTRVYDNYISIVNINLKLPKNRWFFKAHKNYTLILENLGTYYGNLFLETIKHKFNTLFTKNKKFLIKLCFENDRYGKPKKKIFKEFGKCSPNNLRYILQSFIILTFMEKQKLNTIDIIEIGGGYGGLAFFIIKLAELFNITIKSYTIFDLLDVSKLQKAYLEALNVNNISTMNFYQLDHFQNLKKNSFLISNYAFSEISMELQKKYTEQILNPYVSYGFLIWNYIPIYNFIENKIISSEIEYPDTSGNNTNYYITFIPK